MSDHSDFDIKKLKSVNLLAPLPPLDPSMLRLINFASQYYVHSLGETILPTIPQMWKKSDGWDGILQKIAEAEKEIQK